MRLKLYFVNFVCFTFFALGNAFGENVKVYNIKSDKSVPVSDNYKKVIPTKYAQNKSLPEKNNIVNKIIQEENNQEKSEDELDIRGYYSNLPDTIEKILPTVVSISVTKSSTLNTAEYYDDVSAASQSLGSGFIIDEDGYIITNNHVIDGAEKINIKLKGSDINFPAEIIGIDEIMDIALLKISLKSKLPYVEFDQTNNYKVGDSIIVAGNPYNLGVSVSTGIISALNRNLQMSSFDNFIQTDASINKGNSGGPMFNLKGKVIGLTSAIYSPDGENTGIGFAMPVSDLLPIIEELKKYGYVRRGWIGITAENTQKEVFEVLGSQIRKGGAIITDIVKNSPAEKAGLIISDIILSYNGKKIRNAKDLSVSISSTEIGSVVDIVALRDNNILRLKTKVDETKENYKYDPQYEAILSKAIEVFDMVLIPINKESRKRFKISDDIDGLYVLKTKRGGLADKKGIRTGDVVLSINQERAIDGKVILENIHKAELNKMSYVFLITKGSKNNLIFMPIKRNLSSNINS